MTAVPSCLLASPKDVPDVTRQANRSFGFLQGALQGQVDAANLAAAFKTERVTFPLGSTLARAAEVVLCRVPACKNVKVYFIADQAYAANATNYHGFNVKRKTVDATGVAVSNVTMRDLDKTNALEAWYAHRAVDLGLNQNTTCSDGDVLVLDYNTTGKPANDGAQSWTFQVEFELT